MPKGTTLTSYDPSLRDRLAWALSDTFGGDDRGRRNWINEKVRGAADIVPGVGEAIGVDETKRAFNAGNYGEAALGAAGTALGAIPGGGDLAAAGLKGAGSALGMLIGPSSKLWNQRAADQALEMAEGGQHSANDIWLATGTGSDKKGAPLYQEIADQNAAVHPDKRMQKEWGGMSGRDALETWGWGNYEAKGPVPLGNVLTHPELFEAYPELKYLSVEDIEGWGGPEGNYKGNEALIGARSPSFINPQSSLLMDPYKDTRSTMLHEVQHAIQDREGWDPGFNPSAAQSTMGRSDSFARQMYNNAVREMAGLKGINLDRPTEAFAKEASQLSNKVAFETYLRDEGETQARNVQRRAEMDPMLRVAKMPRLTADRTPYETLPWEDIVSGSFGPEGVPGLSMRGPVKKRPPDALKSLDEILEELKR